MKKINEYINENKHLSFNDKSELTPPKEGYLRI